MLLALVGMARADEPAVTILADFEDSSVAPAISETHNVLASACRASRATIPARGQGSLGIEISATEPNAVVSTELTFREATRFAQADRLGAYCWINQGTAELALRIRDANEQIFELPAQAVRAPYRWVHLQFELQAAQLKPLRGQGSVAYPIELAGLRVAVPQTGRQTVFIDDLQVEHRVPPQELVQTTFAFDQTTHLYEPGATVQAAVMLENRSRSKALAITVDLSWMRPGGSVLQTQQANLNLPPSGVDYRSRFKLPFAQRVDEPGLYRLVAQARSTGWTAPNVRGSSFAVTPSNRRAARGRATFFAARTDLLREADEDQLVEISVARDAGVNLLALETPWRLLEPAAGAYDFQILEPVVEALRHQDADLAALFVISDAPAWAPAEPEARTARVGAFITALAQRFGERARRFQVGSGVLPQADLAAQLEAVKALGARLRGEIRELELLPPAIPVGGGGQDARAPDAFNAAAFAQSDPAFPLVFKTSGSTDAALGQLAEYAQRTGLQWRPAHWWMHEAAPLVGAGYAADAEAVLRHYVKAAEAGVAGLIWSDLRDNDNEPSRPAGFRGLVLRDFSPKTTLMGYAVAAGKLTGHRYAGPLQGTPAEFESALFIGGTQQVGVIRPRPNRLLPMFLSPVSGAPGELVVEDFDRRACPFFNSAAPPLVPVSTRPMFITLTLREAEPEPQLSLAQPWVRAPRIAFCGADTPIPLEADVLGSGHVRVQLPSNAPCEAQGGSLAVRGERGRTVRAELRLTARRGADFERAAGTLRIALGESSFEAPLEIRRLTEIRPLAAGGQVQEPAYRIAEPSSPLNVRAGAKAAVHAAYQADALQLAVVVEDRRLVPFREARGGGQAGDQVLLGLARAGTDAQAQVRIEPAQASPSPVALRRTSAEQLAGWKCEAAGTGPQRTYLFSIPAEALGGQPLSPGVLLLIAVQYVNDDADGFPPATLAWGGDVRSGEPASYCWVRLGGGSAAAAAK